MVWPELCRAMHVWLMESETQCAQISSAIDTDRTPWVSHEAYYGYWMVALCLRRRWAQEKWIRGLLYCLCMQFQVDTAVALAEKLRVCMDRDDSMTYVGFSFRSKRPYYGLVGDRAPYKRWVEHWRSIRQHQITRQGSRQDETRREKYPHMAGNGPNGGVSQWLLTLYIVWTTDRALEATAS